MIKMLVSFCLVFLINTVMAKNQMDIEVGKEDKYFTVVLPANPTTGYQWQLKKYDKKILKLLNSQYKAPNDQLIGSGGQMLYEFKLIALQRPSQTKVELQYARPWEENKGETKTIMIYFNQ